MLRRVALLLPLLLLAPLSGARADDLTGLWRVEGTLADGTAYEGMAGLVQTRDDVYRLWARGSLADGRGVSWRGSAERAGDVLEVRHWRGGAGLVRRLLGGGGVLTGSYELAADERSFAGEDSVGPLSAGAVRYQRLPDPRARILVEPAAPLAQAPFQVRVEVEPALAAALVRLEGPGITRRRRTPGLVQGPVDGLPAGDHSYQAFLGDRRGPLLAEADLAVGVAPPALLEDLLREVAQAAAAGEEPVVVFDLDDTLFDTRQRVVAILRRYGADEGEPRLEAVSADMVRYDLEETLAAAGLTPAEVDGPLGRGARRAWGRGFFSGRTYHLDGVFPGAVDYVHAAQDAGARIVYLTGRRESHRPGSERALEDAGYPIPDGRGVRLYMKPERRRGQPRVSTPDFKASLAVDTILPLGRVVALLDNDRDNCNALRAALPETVIVWVDTLYDPSADPVGPGVERITGYE